LIYYYNYSHPPSLALSPSPSCTLALPLSCPCPSPPSCTLALPLSHPCPLAPSLPLLCPPLLLHPPSPSHADPRSHILPPPLMPTLTLTSSHPPLPSHSHPFPPCVAQWLGVACSVVGGAVRLGGVVSGGAGCEVRHLSVCTVVWCGVEGAGAGHGKMRHAGLQCTGLRHVGVVWGVVGTSRLARRHLWGIVLSHSLVTWQTSLWRQGWGTHNAVTWRPRHWSMPC
jgi:hypothetical protein